MERHDDCPQAAEEESAASMKEAAIYAALQQQLGARTPARSHIRKLLPLAKKLLTQKGDYSSMLDVGEAALTEIAKRDHVDVTDIPDESFTAMAQIVSTIDLSRPKEALEQVRQMARGKTSSALRALISKDPIRREGQPLGRNHPCPCGCGKKVKQCPRQKKQ